MYVPHLGNAIPKHEARISPLVGKLILKLSGWQFEGELPNLPSYVVLAAPHTSNWDAFYGFAGLLVIGVKISWMAKNSIFRKPLGGLLKRLGGIPIDRTSSHGVVQQTVQALKRGDGMILVVAPEGTRKRVEKWKTGFYHVAKEAAVPIVPGFLDYSRKRLGFGPAVFPTDDKTADMVQLQDFYKSITGKRPECFNKDILGE